MVDSCYICRRTQVDLDRLDEEIRTRVYLSYFSNARSQIDEQRRTISFLERLKDEESGDPHFRIGAKQVFADPMAYKKLMPWVDTLQKISESKSSEPTGTIGELVASLLTEERRVAAGMEEGLNRIRGAFAAGGNSPISLQAVTYSFPVEWAPVVAPFAWQPSLPGEREPLRREPGQPRASVDVPIHLCSVCLRLIGKVDTP